MKKILLALIALTFLTMPGLAVEKLYVKEGYTIYKCTSRGTGGYARVRKRSDGSFVVFGGVKQGVLKGLTSYAAAARTACGEDSKD